MHLNMVAGADLRHRFRLFRPLPDFLRTLARPLIPLRISLRIHHIQTYFALLLLSNYTSCFFAGRTQFRLMYLSMFEYSVCRGKLQTCSFPMPEQCKLSSRSWSLR